MIGLSIYPASSIWNIMVSCFYTWKELLTDYRAFVILLEQKGKFLLKTLLGWEARQKMTIQATRKGLRRHTPIWLPTSVDLSMAWLSSEPQIVPVIIWAILELHFVLAIELEMRGEQSASQGSQHHWPGASGDVSHIVHT